MVWVSCSLALGAAFADIAAAQEPRVIVGGKLLVEGQAETPFPIQIRDREELPKNSFVRIEGDLTGLTLSQGHRVSRRAWAVPLGKLGLLTVKRDVGAGNGARALRILLVALSGGAFKTYASAEVSILAATPVAAPVAPAAEPTTRGRGEAVMRATSELPVGGDKRNAAPPAPRPALSPAMRARAQVFLDRGNTLLGNGQIVQARLFYQRAARIELAAAAMAMAATYDPAELQALGVVGIDPDLVAARKWYQTAEDLGAAGARARLARLSQRGG